MGMWGSIENVVMKASKPLAKVESSLSAARTSAWASKAKGISSSLARDMKTNGFAVKAAGLGAAGGAAGYYGGDPRDRASNTMKGFGLGVVGAAGWQASKNTALRGAMSEGWGAAKGFSPTKWVGNMAEKERYSSTLRNMAPHSAR